EAADAPSAMDAGLELLGTTAREQIARDHLASPVFSGSLSTVIGGDRRVFTVTDFSGPEGSAGLAADISEIEAMQAERQRLERGHAETLDRLNTAVVIFDANQDLRFFNQAFQKLWDLDIAFLDSRPDN